MELVKIIPLPTLPTGSTRAMFRDTHCLVGVVPCWGLSQKLSRLVGPGRARWASLTASVVNAQKAEAWGLLVEVVNPEELRPAALALATAVAGLRADVVRQYKKTLSEGFGLPLREALLFERKRAREQYSGLGQSTIAGQAESALRAKL